MAGYSPGPNSYLTTGPDKASITNADAQMGTQIQKRPGWSRPFGESLSTSIISLE
jgi:hypothetical protein